jgi:peptidyl-prolyl cis-trans isomerase SurA
MKRQIESGAISFGDAARQISEDGTRNAGGDLGWFVRGDYDPSFEDVAFATDKGKVSEPFRTTFGLHLVTIVDVREKQLSAPEDAEAVKRQILFRLREKQIERLYKTWVRGLRGDAFVEIKDLGLDQ